MFGGQTASAVALGLGIVMAMAPGAQQSLAKDTVLVTDTVGRTVEAPRGAQRVLLGFYFEDYLRDRR